MDEFALCWNNFADNIASGFQNLYDRGDLVDVTIACDGKLLKAHKIVLAICSPYFQEMFMTNPCKHPIIVLKDVSLNVMQELLQFMYQGEVNVKHSELQSFMKIAETLQIKGLTASHKQDRGSASPGQQPAPAHSNSNVTRHNLKDLGGPSTSQIDPSKLSSYLAAAAAQENLKRSADSVFPADQYPIHYPAKKTLKRCSESTEQESNSDCMDNLSSDEVFIPASPQISMVEQSPTARQFDLSTVKRENTNDSMSSPQQSPTNLATSAAAAAAAAATMGASAATGLKLGITSTPIHHPSLHSMFGAFDPSSTNFSGISNSFAASMTGATGNGAGNAPAGKLDHANDYSQDFAKGLGPGHMDIPAVAPGEKWFQGRLQFMLSQRGKPLLVHDGHSFGIQYVRKDKKYWQCNLSRKYNCKARVTTTDTGDIIVTNNEHCHTEIRQHLRKDYKSMKQLNASLAALRARQQEAINISLGVGSAENSHNSTNIGHSPNNNNNNLSMPNNNNNKLTVNVSNSMVNPLLPLDQQPEQETSLNLSTSNWQPKNEPLQSSE